MKRFARKVANIGQLDRRYIFLVMALAVGLPFLFPFHFDARASDETLRFDRALDQAIASPKPIIVGVDFGPQTMAEMEPILVSLMHKIFSKKKKVIFLTFMTETTGLMHRYLAEMEELYDIKYGVDYLNLGYATPYFMVIYAMGTAIEEFYHEDDRGMVLADIPIMEGVHKLEDAAAVINIASNAMPQHWITWAVAPFGINLLVACTATQATDYYPYLQTGQIKGLIAGGRAGAELEGLMVDQGIVASTGDATRGLASCSIALVGIIAFIILGNIAFFVGRGGDREEIR
jgi:hypothetical protein